MQADTEGCITRRWNGKGGGRRWVPGIGGVQSSSGSVSLEKVSTFCSAAETDSGGTELEHADGAGAWVCRAVAYELDGAKSESRGVARAETDFDGLLLESSDDTGAVDLSGTQSVPGAVPWQGGPFRCDPTYGQREVPGVFSSSVPACLACGAVVLGGDGLRSGRVSVTLHQNLGCTPLACSTARNSQNSLARDTGEHDAMQRVIRSGRNSVKFVGRHRSMGTWLL